MDLAPFYEKHGKERVDEAITILTYKKVDPMPKTEDPNKQIMYIFRHGQSQDNLDFVFSGWRDADITDLGVKQALELAPKLKDKNIQMLISSTQLRAIKTLEHAISNNEYAKELTINTDDRIKERSYGDYQGQSKLEFQLEDPEGLLVVRRDYYNVPPNGESLEMVCERVAEFCDEIIPLMKEKKINVAISCHGNSIRGFRKYFEKLTPEETAIIETPLGKDYAAYSV